jgi:hypothetical protein
MATVNQIKADRRKGVSDAYRATRLVNSKLEILTRSLRNLKGNRVKIPEGKDWDRILTQASQVDSELNSLLQTLSAGTALYTTVQ